jgi:hypothetical protein
VRERRKEEIYRGKEEDMGVRQGIRRKIWRGVRG